MVPSVPLALTLRPRDTASPLRRLRASAAPRWAVFGPQAIVASAIALAGGVLAYHVHAPSALAGVLTGACGPLAGVLQDLCPYAPAPGHRELVS